MPNPIQWLTASIIALFEEPLSNVAVVTANPALVFETEDYANLLAPPLTYTSTLAIDPNTRTAMPTLQVESMRSQKVISFGALRIEVQDRSGSADIEKSTLPELMRVLSERLGSGRTRDIGANHDLLLMTDIADTASAAIARGVFSEVQRLVPSGLHLIGGSGRFSLSADDGITFTVAIEPRFNEPLTRNIWMSCNGNISSPTMPDQDGLNQLLHKVHSVLLHVQRSAFANANNGGMNVE